ncbi:hypothetical protein [Streptomyces sp. NPDC005438]|uniref:hypothetical protein n=1 Tax=Streptomyces sp. NPDC005438 TaxID=3156880 RepID=UPI0033A77A8F
MASTLIVDPLDLPGAPPLPAPETGARWLPPGPVHTAVRAGRWWDAIRMGQGRAQQVLDWFREQAPRGSALPGPVIAEVAGPRSRVYFLVPPTTARRWREPETRALGQGSYVVVPPLDSRSHSLHWLVPPVPERRLTPPDLLRQALRT